MKANTEYRKVESHSLQPSRQAKSQKSYMADNRNTTPMKLIDIIQRVGIEKEEEILQGKFESIQQKSNNTGLPDNLKSGVENMSGLSMDDVHVHYHSDKPAEIQAHAYTQGRDIHIAPGQEKHPPHELGT